MDTRHGAPSGGKPSRRRHRHRGPARRRARARTAREPLLRRRGHAPRRPAGLPRYSALETGDAALLGQRAAEVFADFLPESLENLSLESIRAGAMGRMERYGLYKS